MEVDKRKVNFDSLPWQTPLPGARFKAFQQGNTLLRLVEFSKGFMEPDWCAKGHVGYVLEGEVDIDFDGKTVRFSAGDGLMIPKGKKDRHKAIVVTDIVRVILVEEGE